MVKACIVKGHGRKKIKFPYIMNKTFVYKLRDAEWTITASQDFVSK